MLEHVSLDAGPKFRQTSLIPDQAQPSYCIYDSRQQVFQTSSHGLRFYIVGERQANTFPPYCLALQKGETPFCGSSCLREVLDYYLLES